TLVRWGDVLVRTIVRATRDQVVTTVESARPGDKPGDGCAEVVLRLRGNDYRERWLLSESWWAQSFPAPSYRELVSWSLRALPWAIVTHIGERYWQARSGGWNQAKVAALATTLFQLFVALALTPLFIALLALVLPLGLLPIPYLRSLILSAQFALNATVGDSL